MKKFKENIDPNAFLAYNRIMSEQKSGKFGRILRNVFLTAASIAMLCWIFSNSLQTGSQSSEQSARITSWVQKIFRFFAPDSFVANATGAEYRKLHSVIRMLAHFAEFALLGALWGWTCLSYSRKTGYFAFTALLILLVPVVDEFLQMHTAGRGAELKDLLIDTAGGFAGLLFAGLTVWLGCAIARKKENEKEKGV